MTGGVTDDERVIERRTWWARAYTTPDGSETVYRDDRGEYLPLKPEVLSRRELQEPVNGDYLVEVEIIVRRREPSR